MVSSRFQARIILVAAVFLAAMSTADCGTGTMTPTPVIGVTAAAWPDADALFRRDPRWLGGDAAFSVALGGDRILWLFGDSFIATSPANVRTESKMVRNSVAVQSGADPTTATVSFHWRPGSTADDAKPASFFPEQGAEWHWPQHGLRIGDRLVLFLTRVQPTPGQGLGFVAVGWRLALIDNPDDDADQWHIRYVDAPTVPAGLTVGAALVAPTAGDDHVVALALREPGDHAGYLARWSSEALAAGHLDAAEWWTGSGGWLSGGAPAVVIADAGAECSLQWNAPLSTFVHVKSEGFGATTVALRFADQLTGPWSPPRIAFRPPESDQPNAFVYAAKAHPELSGADLVVTYVANTFGPLSTLLSDTTLYYPRFVKIALQQ
jgi:hypothetical protein